MDRITERITAIESNQRIATLYRALMAAKADYIAMSSEPHGYPWEHYPARAALLRARQAYLAERDKRP